MGGTNFLASAMLAAVSSTLGTPAMGAAPGQLYGKSIVVTWSETQERKPAVQPFASNTTVHADFSVYVSSAGRVFNRLTWAGFIGGRPGYRYRSDSTDQVNGEGSGQKRNVDFSGRTMTNVTLMEGGARRVLVTFASDFSSCSAEVLIGRSAGVTKVVTRGGIDGTRVEILSVLSGAANCSVQAGNVFGH